jgi:signal transduction histidine kinase
MRHFFATPLLAFILVASAAAQTATRSTAEALVKEGVAFMKANGKDAFIAEVQKASGRFHRKPDSTLYLFAHNLDCVVVAEGNNIGALGLNRTNVKDPDGKFLVREMVKAGQQKGGGWVDYKWPNPTTNKVENKSTYCLAEGGIVVGCGYFK